MAEVVGVTKQVDLAELSNLLGTQATIVNGADPLSANAKTIDANVEQATLTNVVNNYVFVPAGERLAEEDLEDLLQPFAGRAAAVLAGTDAYTATDIQRILAAYVRSNSVG